MVSCKTSKHFCKDEKDKEQKQGEMLKNEKKKENLLFFSPHQNPSGQDRKGLRLMPIHKPWWG